MKRLLTSALALGLVATSIPTTAFARDRDWRHDRYEYSHRNHRGDAVAAGVIGLALGAVLGAAITNSNHRRYDRRYDRCDDRCDYDRGYSDNGYYEEGYDDYGPSVCVVRERRWDPYRGREIYFE